MRLDKAVKALRKHTRESQQAFATRLGISIRALAFYEAGRAPTGKALAALARVAQSVGKHELAYLFMDALMEELDIRQMKLGLFSADLTSDNPRGYMFVGFEGCNARDYARAFFEMFGRLVSADAAERAAAETILDALNNSAQSIWRRSK